MTPPRGTTDANGKGVTEPEGVMPWEPERTELEWSDREAWRGDRHNDDSVPCCDDSDDEATPEWDPRDTAEMAAWDESADEPESANGWPENLAGPEYWMYKHLTD